MKQNNLIGTYSNRLKYLSILAGLFKAQSNITIGFAAAQ